MIGWGKETQEYFDSLADGWGNFITRLFVKRSMRVFVNDFFVEKEWVRKKIGEAEEFLHDKHSKSILKALKDEI